MSSKIGDSTDMFNITVEGTDGNPITDYTGYRGEVAILNPTDNTILLGKLAVTPNVTEGFYIAFTPAQTATLIKGSYPVVFEMVKEEDTVITFRREISWSLQISESLINVESQP